MATGQGAWCPAQRQARGGSPGTDEL